jgi:hypothetical protein
LEKLSLTKTIEARKLNKRTGVPTTDPEVTIPFGSFVEDIELDRDMVKFTYHGEPYRCAQDLLMSALEKKTFAAAAGAEAPTEAASPEPVEKPKLQWEPVESTHYSVMRARVPGGWLVSTGGTALAYCPDPNREW